MLSPSDRRLLGDNLERIRERIASACARSARDATEVALVAVTKYAGVPFARGLLELGQRDLGENRVGHLVELAEGLAAVDLEGTPGPRWHMIGHLQRNKAKRVAGLLDVLHSLDSLELAHRLDSTRPDECPPLAVYVQIRLGDGPDRSGIEAEDLGVFLEGLGGLTRLRVAGLMGLPPLGTPEEARAHFRGLREALKGVEQVQESGPWGLSMGMTSDLEVAIEEGATVVRVGRALLEGLSEEARRR